MRRLAAILAAALVLTGVAAPATASAAAVSASAPGVAAPAPDAALGPKVVIIVGPVHDGTAQYQGFGDQVYNEARKYTNNVVRVYSPNATWSKVVAAVTGAAIVVNIGHGNGYPSPYGFDSTYTKQNGFGLNYDVNGDGKLSNFELRYYGEKYIRTLKMAPNAVVMLFHMCYSAGNQEPGGPEPTLTVARQRADNFASAFLAAGAKSVFAIAHTGGNDAYYIRSLFTTRQPLVDVFLHAPEFHNHVYSFPSVRTPGALQLLDTDTATPTGFYRAYTGDTTSRTEEITGGAFAATNVDPAALEVPGNANPIADDMPIFGTPDDAANTINAIDTLPAATLLRVTGQEAVTSVADGSPIYAVTDNGSISGYMPGTSLVPRDSTPPRVWQVADGSGMFSPNGDGVADTYPLSIKLSESSAWDLEITNNWGNPITATSGSSDTAALTWAPSPGSVSDGQYRWHVTATDALGNGPSENWGTFTIDRIAPTLGLPGDPAAPLLISPNGDKVRDTITLAPTSTERGLATATIRNGLGDTVATLVGVFWGTGATVFWDGRDTGGAVVANGSYEVSVVATDEAGNASAAQTRSVQVYSALGFATAAPAIFFPQDADAIAATTTVGFTLADPATVTWTIIDATGALVRTISTAEAMDAGVHTFVWDGRDDLGVFVPRGAYRSVVTAGDGTVAATQVAGVYADAFKTVSSDTTPAHLQRITITATTAEKLSTTPRLYVIQPGRTTWSVLLTKVSSTVYRATITVRSGAIGTVKFKVLAKDSTGKAQYSVLALPLH